MTEYEEPLELVTEYLREKGVTAWCREIGPTFPILEDSKIPFESYGIHVEIAQPLGKMEEVILDHFRWLCQRNSWELHLISRSRVRMKDIHCMGMKRTIADPDTTVLELEVLWTTPEEQRHEVYRSS